MTTRSFKFAPDEFYHVYNRGVDKRNIFNSHKDQILFLERMYLANGSESIDIRDIKKHSKSVFDWDRGEQQVAIGAFCLMPNHFHILLKPLQENGVSTFMSKLSTSYTMYFNKNNERTGALFQGAFKAEYVESDRYLKYLYSYIHLNPIKLLQSDWKEKGIQNPETAYEYAASYQYSSLPAYIGTKHISHTIISPEHFPDYFQTSAGHQKELMEWLTFNQT